MKEAPLNEMLEKEKIKLNRLADEALKNGTPIIENEAVIAQSRKVDALVVKIQRKKKWLFPDDPHVQGYKRKAPNQVRQHGTSRQGE